MLWAIKLTDTYGGAGLVVPDSDTVYAIGDSFPIVFDSYREACLWIVEHVDNRDDRFEVIAYIPE